MRKWAMWDIIQLQLIEHILEHNNIPKFEAEHYADLIVEAYREKRMDEVKELVRNLIPNRIKQEIAISSISQAF